MKLPAFQFYPGDWRKDPGVQSLSYHDRGVWFEILLLMFESEDRGKLMLRGQPMPEDALSRLLGLDKQSLLKSLDTLLEYGVASRDPVSGALFSRRMVRDEELRQTRTTAGRMGGNPVLLNQKVKHPVKQKPTTGVNQKSTPSASASLSTSTSVHKPPIPPEKVREIYEAYPRRQNRKAAETAIRKAVDDGVETEHLLERTRAYSSAVALWPEVKRGFIPYPATWYNAAGYDDDPTAWVRHDANGTHPNQLPRRIHEDDKPW